MMSPSLHWHSVNCSQMPLSKNRLPNRQLREQSLSYSKPLNWKEQQLLRLRVRPKQQNKLVNLCLPTQHILIWDAWRQQRTLQFWWDRVETKFILTPILSSLTSHNLSIIIWIEKTIELRVTTSSNVRLISKRVIRMRHFKKLQLELTNLKF